MKLRALVSVVALLVARPAHAHPEHCAQSLFVEVEADRVSIAVELSPGSAVARALVERIDSNRDGAIDERERQRYSAALSAQLSVAIDGAPLEVQCEPLSISSPSVLETGAASVTVRCAAPSRARSRGAHELSVRSDHRPVTTAYSIHVFTASGGPQVTAVRRALDGRAALVRFSLERGNRAWRRRARAIAAASALLIGCALGGWLRRRTRASIARR